ncbi:MAG: ComF family protein, partial [Chloroflexia bacterium]
GEWLCASCRGRSETYPAYSSKPTGLDAVYVAYEYRGPVRELVHRFKYDGLRAAGGWMSAQMAPRLEDGPTVLVPIPLHRSRERERGYNQAAVLANGVARRTGIPTRGLLSRTRSTPPQALLSAAERRLNVRGAFEANPGARATDTVVFVDDACTTGSTMGECAELLRGIGATRVVGLVFAKPAGGVIELGM